MHKKKCKIYVRGSGPGKGRSHEMTLGWAGTSCLDVCRPGKRRGRLGPQSKAFKVWCAERRARREKIYFQESTEDFDPAAIVEEVGDLFTVQAVLMGPEDFGWWCSRRRSFCILILKAAGVLAGDFETFMKLFFRSRPCGQGCRKGHMFWAAGEARVSQYKESFAQETGATAAAVEGTSWRELLCPGNQSRLASYDVALEEKRLKQLADEIATGGMKRSSMARSSMSFSSEVVLGDMLICNIRNGAGQKMGQLSAHVPLCSVRASSGLNWRTARCSGRST